MIDTTRSMLFHVNNLNTENQRISYQMGTGKVLQKGSDDSLLHANIIQIEEKLRVTQNLQLQIVKTKAANEVSDSSFQEMKDVIDKIKVDLLKGLNAGMDRNDKLALATNLRGLRENIYDLVNVRVDGEYVFSGSVTTQQAFEKDEFFDQNGKVDFEGDNFLRKIAVQPGSYRDRGVTGFDLAFYTSQRAIVGESFSFELDGATNPEYGERIIDSEGHEWKLNAAEDKIQRYDHNGVVYHPPIEIDVAETTAEVEADATQQATKRVFTTVGTIPSTITTSSGEVVDIAHVQFEAKHNYFEDLNIIINALEGRSTRLNGQGVDTINDALVDTTLRTGLDQTTLQFDYTNIGHGELGGRNNVFNIAYDKLIAQETHYNILLTETNGADMTKLAMESKQLELTYSGLYSTITRMNELSLVNFIR